LTTTTPRPPEGDDEIHTTELLAKALEATLHPLGVGNDQRVVTMVKRARAGYYHDCLSKLDAPQAQLVVDLREVGLNDLAVRAANGEFGDTKAEWEAWMRTPAADEYKAFVAANPELNEVARRTVEAVAAAQERGELPDGAAFIDEAESVTRMMNPDAPPLAAAAMYGDDADGPHEAPEDAEPDWEPEDTIISLGSVFDIDTGEQRLKITYGRYASIELHGPALLDYCDALMRAATAAEFNAALFHWLQLADCPDTPGVITAVDNLRNPAGYWKAGPLHLHAGVRDVTYDPLVAVDLFDPARSLSPLHAHDGATAEDYVAEWPWKPSEIRRHIRRVMEVAGLGESETALFRYLRDKTSATEDQAYSMVKNVMDRVVKQQAAEEDARLAADVRAYVDKMPDLRPPADAAEQPGDGDPVAPPTAPGEPE